MAAFIGVRGVSSTELAFVSDRNGTKEIYVMDADGGRQRAVTANRSINNFPGWSPDGDSIVFTSYRHRNQPNLFVTTRGRGSPQRLLTGLDPDLSQYRGVFDPTGKRLAVVMSDGGPSEIYSVLAGCPEDSSHHQEPGDRRLAQPGRRTANRSPSSRTAPARPRSTSWTRTAGTCAASPTTGATTRRPAWSPDGKWIAYETRVEGQFDIWLIDPEGAVNVPLVTHPRSDEAPAWAPNSRKLAFSSTRRGRADIYVVDVGGGEPRRLTQGAGNNTSPAWGPFPR